MDAGYAVSSIDLAAREVVFRKLKRRYEVRRVGDTIQWDGDTVRHAALRMHLGVSQAQLAETLGMRQQTVSEWETGVDAPTRWPQRPSSSPSWPSGRASASAKRQAIRGISHRSRPEIR